MDRVAVRDENELERQVEHRPERGQDALPPDRRVPDAEDAAVRAVMPSAKTIVRCSGAQIGVSVEPRPSYRATRPPGSFVPGMIGSTWTSGARPGSNSRGPNAGMPYQWAK